MKTALYDKCFISVKFLTLYCEASTTDSETLIHLHCAVWSLLFAQVSTSSLSIPRSALRNWLFQVSKDGKNWTTLYTHTDDNSLNEPGYVYENLCPLFSSDLKKCEGNTFMCWKSASYVTVRHVGKDNLIFALPPPTRRVIPRLLTCSLGNSIDYCCSKETEEWILSLWGI